MIFTKPVEPNAAFDFLMNKVLVGTPLSSAEMADLKAELLVRGFFSSRIESMRFLQRAQDSIGDYLAGNVKTLPDGQTLLATGGRAAFVDQMQKFLAREGVQRGDGSLTDITSHSRLALIFDFQTHQAGEYAYWKSGMDENVLHEFPASRFIREKSVKEPRLNHAQFEGQVFLKTDPIWWTTISQFGLPWPPFAFGCGHGIADVDRDEAEALGLIKPGQRLQPVKKFFNENLQASAHGIEPELLAKMKEVFGDQITIENDTIKWKGKTDERRNSDGASGRLDDAAAVDPRAVGRAGQEIFRDVRSRDTGESLPPAVALSGGAALSAVADGRKPLYHDEWGQALGSDLARRLWGLKLPGVEISLQDGHLYAYRPEVVQAIIAADPAAYPGLTLAGKIHAASVNSTNGELLGYGARTMFEPDRVLVEILDGDVEVFGFYSRRAVADQFAQARTLDFDRAYGRSFSYRIRAL